MLLFVKLQTEAYNFSNINTPLWVFFMSFKLYKLNRIEQSITHRFYLLSTFLSIGVVARELDVNLLSFGHEKEMITSPSTNFVVATGVT